MPVNVKHLTSDDTELMNALLETFGTAFNDMPTYTASRPSEAYLKNLLSGDSFIALYTKLGTREDVLHFDIPVGAGDRNE